MTKVTLLTFFLHLVFFYQAESQSIDSIRDKIEKIIQTKNAVVGVAINGTGKDALYINGAKHFPMQSVFKFHIGLTMLVEIDKGNFSLDQKVDIKKDQLLPGLWSPIREKYPEGTILTIAEIIEYTITLSDNAGCDVLLKMLGGPQVVENYFAKNNFRDFSLKINEETMQNNWDLQFQNWTTPKESNNILQTFYYNKHGLLSKKSHQLVWDMMKATGTGKNQLKGQLPEGTVVAHKTGWSGVHKSTGIIAAINDIGVVFMQDGEPFFISVFVTESKESKETNEKIISDIAKAAWDYFESR